MVVNYLRGNGFPHAERRVLKGALDRGDVTGCVGLCFEVKYAGISPKIGTWMTETGVEQLNAEADYGILVVKPLGLGEKSVSSWYAIMGAEHFACLSSHVRSIEESKPNGLIVLDGEPVAYSAKTLRWELNAGLRRLAPAEVLALTLRPPGTKEDPARWYRVTTLEHMVKLLRCAGYGDPLPIVEASIAESSDL